MASKAEEDSEGIGIADEEEIKEEMGAKKRNSRGLRKKESDGREARGVGEAVDR